MQAETTQPDRSMPGFEEFCEWFKGFTDELDKAQLERNRKRRRYLLRRAYKALREVEIRDLADAEAAIQDTYLILRDDPEAARRSCEYVKGIFYNKMKAAGRERARLLRKGDCYFKSKKRNQRKCLRVVFVDYCRHVEDCYHIEGCIRYAGYNGFRLRRLMHCGTNRERDDKDRPLPNILLDRTFTTPLGQPRLTVDFAPLTYAWQKLSPDEQKLIVANNVSRLSFREIAEQTGENENTLSSRSKRAMDKLRDAIASAPCISCGEQVSRNDTKCPYCGERCPTRDASADFFAQWDFFERSAVVAESIAPDIWQTLVDEFLVRRAKQRGRSLDEKSPVYVRPLPDPRAARPKAFVVSPLTEFADGISLKPWASCKRLLLSAWMQYVRDECRRNPFAFIDGALVGSTGLGTKRAA